MTTERRQPNLGPRLGVNPLELRLYTVALLGAVYAISWRALGGQVSTTDDIATTQTTKVWIDDLPPDLRPTFVLPPGWQRASEPVTQPARVVQVPDRRAPRVRTRSS